MTKFAERDPIRIGIIGTLVVVALVLIALNISNLAFLTGGSSYSAQFTEAGGLKTGDEVRIGGFKVGRVDKVSLDGPYVLTDFTVTDSDVHLGKDTTASVNVATILGDRYLNLVSQGPGQLSAGEPIPVARTQSPYDLPEVLETLTNKASNLDVDRVSVALDTASGTLSAAEPQLKGALTGVIALSNTINSRDAKLRELLADANNVSGVLADRSQELKSLVEDGSLLLNELQSRREVIHQLFGNVAGVSEQLNKLAGDNRDQLHPTLERLNSVLEILKHNDANVGDAITGLKKYATGLGEAVSMGPWFAAMVPNLIPPGNLVPLPNYLPEFPPTRVGSISPVEPPAGAPSWLSGLMAPANQGGPR